MGNDTLITLYTYHDAFEADVDRGLLNDSGIPCFIKNEIIGQVYPIGGSFDMELMIHSSDYEQACRLLNINPATGEKMPGNDA